MKPDSAVIARVISRKLKALGYPKGSFGKYRTFGTPEGQCEGFKVKRLGYSKTVVVGYIVPYMFTYKAAGEKAKEKSKEIEEAVRKMGFVVDANGWIDCDKLPDLAE